MTGKLTKQHRRGTYQLGYVDGVPDSEVPSFANESDDTRTVVITHPTNDPAHPNVLAALRRYAAKGWTATFDATYRTAPTLEAA